MSPVLPGESPVFDPFYSPCSSLCCSRHCLSHSSVLFRCFPPTSWIANRWHHSSVFGQLQQHFLEQHYSVVGTTTTQQQIPVCSVWGYSYVCYWVTFKGLSVIQIWIYIHSQLITLLHMLSHKHESSTIASYLVGLPLDQWLSSCGVAPPGETY